MYDLLKTGGRLLCKSSSILPMLLERSCVAHGYKQNLPDCSFKHIEPNDDVKVDKTYYTCAALFLNVNHMNLLYEVTFFIFYFTFFTRINIQFTSASYYEIFTNWFTVTNIITRFYKPRYPKYWMFFSISISSLWHCRIFYFIY